MKFNIIALLLIIIISGISCRNSKNCYYSDEEYLNSSYYKGGWVPKSITSDSFYSICLKNDLDTNKVWAEIHLSDNESLIKYRQSKNCNDYELILAFFKKYSDGFDKKTTYWSNSDICFGTIAENQYYAIDNNKLFFLRIKY